MLLAPPADPTAGLTTELLPADSAFRQAQAAMIRHFPGRSSLSDAVVVFERADGPLTAKDREDIEQLARQLRQLRPEGPPPEQLQSLAIRTPRSLAVLGKHNPFVSPDGKAALIEVGLPYNNTSTAAARLVNHVHAVVDGFRFAPGLAAAVTGSAGYGRDYLLANDRSQDKILTVTLIAVILILLAVYRAPVAAMIPLVGIGLATALATQLMLLGHGIGLSSGTPERMFMLVLLYGAGVDYSVLFISRYRELLDQGCPSAEACVRGLDASLGAIVSSASATAAGLGTLCMARFGVFRDVGPAIVLALVVAAVASLTAIPALVAIIGPRIFWPGRGHLHLAEHLHSSVVDSISSIMRRRWASLAGFVTSRPGLVLLVTLAAMAGPAAQSLFLAWDYDSEGSIKGTYDAVRGAEMVGRHWLIDDLAPVVVLVVADQQPALSVAAWESLCRRVVSDLRALDSVSNVRGLTLPLGPNVDSRQVLKGLPGVLGDPGKFLAAMARPEFLSDDRLAMRLSVTLKAEPQTLAAMEAANRIESAVQHSLAQAGLKASVHLAGPTAETAGLREVTQGDVRRTGVLAIAIILLIVLLLLHNVLLSLFMVAATLLGYAATLGLTYWAFAALGVHGLDWEVEVFLFIMMVAVGQDYNLFFAARLAQEGRMLSPREATEKALVHTGPVISSCGLIMAATLGSLMAGDVKMLQQLGFALALGMLIDTFVVRPLLLPSFIVLTGRTLIRAAKIIR